MSAVLDAALAYEDIGLSIIPVNPATKRPLIKWTRWQSERADEKQLRTWWRDYPDAGIGIVTGAVSGITVIDADGPKGIATLNDVLPDSYQTPTASTPRTKGQHLYLRHVAGVPNSVKVLQGCDVRNDGGYVVAPPSVNGHGAYQWLPGLGILEVPPLQPPPYLLDLLLLHPSSSLSLSSSIRGNSVRNVTNVRTCQELGFSFSEGHRDDTLFSVANCLTKGGMSEENTLKVLEILAAQCDPPFPKNQIEAKIMSALNRRERREKTLAQEVRDFVNLTDADINLTTIRQIFKVSDIPDMTNLYKILSRLVDEGVLKRVHGKRGVYQRVQADCAECDWQTASMDRAQVWLPWDLDLYARIPHGGIVLFAGSPNAGKTLSALNIVRNNMMRWDVHYFSSEVSPSMFRARAEQFPGITVDQWKCHFYEWPQDLSDAIKRIAGPTTLVVVDYIELYEEFWAVGKILADIHAALGGRGVAVTYIQKAKGRDLGIGGYFSQFKPTLSVSVEDGVSKVIKLKEWNPERENINGMIYRWQIRNCEFIKQINWHREATNGNH